MLHTKNHGSVQRNLRRLTVNEVSGKFSHADVWNYYFPWLTGDECMFLQWNFTCYPFSGEHMLKQIFEHYQYYRKHGTFNLKED
jgi:hypothetical protein